MPPRLNVSLDADTRGFHFRVYPRRSALLQAFLLRSRPLESFFVYFALFVV